MESLARVKEQMSELSLARAVIYRFLSRFYSYPDEELLDLLAGTTIQEYVDACRCVGLDVAGEMAEIAGWLKAYPSSQEALLDMQREYTRLFVNAVPGIPAPPYSSVYLDEDGLVWGLSTARAARFYEAAGLTVAQGFGDIPDHICAELEFVSYLVLGQLGGGKDIPVSIEELASIERSFVGDHLSKWAPVFLARVSEHYYLVFYRVMSSQAMRFLDGETKCLGKESEG